MDKHRLPFIILLLLLPGCKTVEYFGAVSSNTFNQYLDKREKFDKDISENQASIAKGVAELAQENIIEAKQDDDEGKLSRSVQTQVNAETSLKKANELADVNYDRVEPGMDWNSLMADILKAVMGAIAAYFGIGIPMGRKVSRLKEKGRKYANSTHVDDISKDKDFA